MSARSRQQVDGTSENVDRLRILFTEGASLSARQTLYALGPLHDIDVIDPDPICQCRFSNYVRHYFRSPSFSKQPAEFLHFVARLVGENHYDVIVPTHEQVYLLSRFRDAFTPHVGLALPDFAALTRLENKAEFSRLLTHLKLPQPETVIILGKAELDQDWTFPFYLKFPHGTGGGGVFHIDSRDALRRYMTELECQGRLTSSSETLIQKPARGVLSTVQAVFNQGTMAGIHMFEARRLGVGGMSTARVGANHPVVRQHMAQIGSHLGWHGAFFIDYFYDHESARPEYIEANPRIGETVNAMLSGVNLAQLLVRISRGEAPASRQYRRIGVRTHNLFMILMSMAYKGSGRMALLRELAECGARRGLYENSQDEITRPREDRMSRQPRFWVSAQLLAWPGAAKRIVDRTIRNYSLPESAIATIQRLPLNLLNKAF